MPKEVKYDYLYGPTLFIRNVPISASQNFENDSGKYVKLSSQRLTIADSGDTQIEGWAQTGDLTSSATAGADSCDLNVCPWSVYRMPADADPAGVLLKTCDLIVNSGNQQVDVGESNEDVLKVYALDTDADTVDVGMNPTKMFATGVV